MTSDAERPRPVTHRRVFYIPGYDPFPARRYRELYRREAAEQARLSGHDIRVAGLPGARGHGWVVSARIDGQDVLAEFEVLAWSDIVRASMRRGVGATYALLARTLWRYLRGGVLFRLARLRRGPVIAALYPAAMLVAQALVALGLAAGIAALVGLALPGWAALVAGAATMPATLAWFRARDRRIYAHYLMHDYAFAAACDGATPPALAARIETFADRVAAALAEGPDEVLVVGHSSGAQIAISVLAGLIRQGRVPAAGPALSLLTLGHAVPMVSFLPRAGALRRDLAQMAVQDRAAWVDVTAPGDGCSFALCDPVLVTGVAPAGKRWPLVISAAFSRTLSPARWARLRRRFFRLHFQYLCAFDNLRGAPGDYDYFRVTAGPLTLARRFAARPPSPSRIERAESPYRDFGA